MRRASPKCRQPVRGNKGGLPLGCVVEHDSPLVIYIFQHQTKNTADCSTSGFEPLQTPLSGNECDAFACLAYFYISEGELAHGCRRRIGLPVSCHHVIPAFDDLLAYENAVFRI